MQKCCHREKQDDARNEGNQRRRRRCEAKEHRASDQTDDGCAKETHSIEHKSKYWCRKAVEDIPCGQHRTGESCGGNEIRHFGIGRDTGTKRAQDERRNRADGAAQQKKRERRGTRRTVLVLAWSVEGSHGERYAEQTDARQNQHSGVKAHAIDQ